MNVRMLALLTAVCGLAGGSTRGFARTLPNQVQNQGQAANVHYFFHFDSSLVARSAVVLSISASWRTWCSRVYRLTMLKRSQLRPAWRVVENHAFPEETTSRAIVF